jgi:hypothetical protein
MRTSKAGRPYSIVDHLNGHTISKNKMRLVVALGLAAIFTGCGYPNPRIVVGHSYTIGQYEGYHRCDLHSYAYYMTHKDAFPNTDLDSVGLYPGDRVTVVRIDPPMTATGSYYDDPELFVRVHGHATCYLQYYWKGGADPLFDADVTDSH